VFDEDGPDPGQPDEPPRRPRGRHAAPRGPVASDGWRTRLVAATTPLLAALEPRLSAAGAWLLERRLHVLIVASTLATVAMIGGAMALISSVGPGRDGEAAELGDSPRPTSTDPGSPNSYAPILPSPGPIRTPSPTATPTPDDGTTDPGTVVPDEPVDPADPVVEPPADTGNGRPDPPGHTNKPPKP